MRYRSLSHRNIAGAFLGGMLGMLCFSSWEPWALPIGTFIGVVIGFCYARIWNGIAARWNRLLRWAGRTAFPRFQLRLPDFRWIRRWSYAIQRAARPVAIFIDPSRSPLRHPMNRMLLARVLAVAVYLGLNGLWVHPAVMRVVVPAVRSDHEVGIVLSFAVVFMLGMMGLVPSSFLGKDFKDRGSFEERRASFYTRYDRYMRTGGPRWFFRDLTTLLRIEAVQVLIGVSTMAYIMGIGLMLVLLVMLPIILLSIAAAAFYEVVRRGEYVLCLAVTLVVTAGVAVRSAPYFSAEVYSWQPWTAGLVAGLLSALCAEAVRLQLRAWCRRSRRLHLFLRVFIGKPGRPTMLTANFQLFEERGKLYSRHLDALLARILPADLSY